MSDDLILAVGELTLPQWQDWLLRYNSVLSDRECRIEKLEAARDGAYTERNRLVAFLTNIYPSGVKKTAIPGWDEAWHNCVYIDLPVGQASWHYHDSEAHLFAHLPAYSSEWDGHTTEEKYERLFLASSHAKQTDELLADKLVPHTKKQADRIKKLEAALDMSEKRFATLKDAWDTLRRRDMPPLYGSAALAGDKKNDG